MSKHSQFIAKIFLRAFTESPSNNEEISSRSNFKNTVSNRLYYLDFLPRF